MAFDHLFWTYNETPNACWLQSLEGYRKKWKINKGKPVSDEFPADASFSMDPEHPTDTLTPDHLTNAASMVVISTKLKEFLAAKELPNVEYQKVAVFNHRKRELDPPYWIVNALESRACLKLAECGAVWNVLDKESVDSITTWVPDEEVCKQLPPLFRPEGLKRYMLIQRSLAEEIDAAGFIGNAWLPPAKIVGKPIPANLRVLVRL